MLTPSISFRLATVAMLIVSSVWLFVLTDFQHDILIMHFAGSAIARTAILPLPVAVLAAFIGWNKGYFRKTYLVVGGLWLALEVVNFVRGAEQKHPQVDLEAGIMTGIIAVAVWFGFELFNYVKQYRDEK